MTAGFAGSFRMCRRARIEKMCRKGEIRVDGGRVKPATRLAEGQRCASRRCPSPATAPREPAAPRDLRGRCADDPGRGALKDDHIIALNKPPGLPSQGGSGQGDRHVDGLAEALRFGLDEKPRLVHRLDKDTSGVLLLARTRAVAKALTEAFRARDTRKIYWAVVAGRAAPAHGHGQLGAGQGAGAWRRARPRRCAASTPTRSTRPRARSAPRPIMR